MSFLRKRSRSQSSGFNGEEDRYSMRGDRKELNERSLVERRYSGVSEMSSRPDDYGLHDSCVIRNFPKHKSSHLPFLAWVAYTRKYDDHTITDDERRTCPLLWCREVFADQDAMLKHVWECEHLSKGLYWCFHCQKPERVGKFQCKRCQGLPSKTDRLTTVARRIFSKLGTKHHRDDFSASGSEAGGMTSLALPKIPESRESEAYPEIQGNFDNEEFPPYEPMSELPNNCISEMENTSIMPEMDTTWNMPSQELRKPHVSDEKSFEYPTGMYSDMVMNPYNHAFSESNPPWSPSSFEAQVPAQKSPGRSVPALALNTRDIYQPQSSMHRHGNVCTLSDEPMSATVISPLSATDGFYSGMLGMSARNFEISPTDSETTYNSLFTNDSGYSSATIDSAMSATSMSFDRIWDTLDMTKKSDYQVFPVASGMNIGKNAGLMLPPSQPSSASSSNVPSRSSSNSSNHSANRCTALVKRKTLSPHWTDSKTLVESFVEVLNEHLEHSRAALKQLPSNSNIKELQAMSSTSIISTGFGVLRGLLEKRNPDAILEIFAFAHVAYAAAIVVDDKSSKVRTDEWFQDSLAWLSGLSSERQRMRYTLIAHAIWKPQDLVEIGDFVDLTKVIERAQPFVDSENGLVKACKHFLDIQENLSNNEKSSATEAFTPQHSPFNFSQASFYRTAKSRIIDELIQKVSIEAFIEDVVAVEKRLREGSIKYLRQLELELICAGKLASQSDTAYERFISHVTCLCDTLYSEGESEKSRTEYQIDDIDITKSLLPEEGSGDDDSIENEELFDYEQPMNNHNTSMDVSSSDALVKAFDMDANGILDDWYSTNPMNTPMESTPLARSHSNPNPPTKTFRQSHVPTPSASAIPTSSPFPPPRTPASASVPAFNSASTTSSAFSPSEKNKYKCHCGYVPRGEEKWKPSNLARHKRTQHPVEVKVYKCGFPGCASTFTRSDNLRSHARDKGHDVGGLGEVDTWGMEESNRERARGREEFEEGRRPSKRRKVEEGKGIGVPG